MAENVDRAKLAAKIHKLLALAESEAAAGNEGARDTLIEKASALQLKYAIEDAMLAAAGQAGTDELTHADFCTESNTPLIKAKRQLINGLAQYNRGQALMMGEWKTQATGKKAGQMKYDRRAKIRVYAHRSDLDFITALYNSLIIQMQTMMATDEKLAAEVTRTGGVPAAWRVSYAYGWVNRVLDRIREAKQRNEAAAEADRAGTALVLRDRSQLVHDHIEAQFGKLRTTRYRRDDHSDAGRRAGRAAADRADLGGKKVGGEKFRLEA
jgi:hypothetical protein